MDFEKGIARIHEHLEDDRIESAVMACLRVARAAKDHMHSAIFLRELYPDKNEVVRALAVSNDAEDWCSVIHQLVFLIAAGCAFGQSAPRHLLTPSNAQGYRNIIY